MFVERMARCYPKLETLQLENVSSTGLGVCKESIGVSMVLGPVGSRGLAGVQRCLASKPWCA